MLKILGYAQKSLETSKCSDFFPATRVVLMLNENSVLQPLPKSVQRVSLQCFFFPAYRPLFDVYFRANLESATA